MRLTILGGADAAGNPNQGCAGFLLAAERTRIVFDLGPGTLLRLRSVTDIRTLDAIVISHLHLDHILDLFALRYTLAYSRIKDSRRVPLWLPPGGEAWFTDIGRALSSIKDAPDPRFFSDQFAINEYDPTRQLMIGDCTVAFAPTIHYVPCWAVRVTTSAEPRGFVYTADMGPASELADFVRDAATILTEASSIVPDEGTRAVRGHQTAREAGLLAQSAGADLVVLTHWTIQDAPEQLYAEAAAEFSGNIRLAAPGMSLEW